MRTWQCVIPVATMLRHFCDCCIPSPSIFMSSQTVSGAKYLRLRAVNFISEFVRLTTRLNALELCSYDLLRSKAFWEQLLEASL